MQWEIEEKEGIDRKQYSWDWTGPNVHYLYIAERNSLELLPTLINEYDTWRRITEVVFL